MIYVILFGRESYCKNLHVISRKMDSKIANVRNDKKNSYAPK